MQPKEEQLDVAAKADEMQPAEEPCLDAERGEGEAEAIEAASPVKPETDGEPEDRNQAPVKRRRWLWILLGIAVLAIGWECAQRWRIERAISSAFDKLELPYVLGAEGPNAYDCSSLVQSSFADAGSELPRLAVDIGYCDRYRTIEEPARLLRGDVVCFDTIQDADLSDHVGIYLGGNRFIHASSGKKKVIVSELTGYYAEHFSWGKRMVRHLPVDIPVLWEASQGEERDS